MEELMRKILLGILLLLIFIVGCTPEEAIIEPEVVVSEPDEQEIEETQLSGFMDFPYVPDEGAWLFIGQDLGAVGGLENYDNGYIDYFGEPAGVTTYTGTKSLGGLYTLDNWGAGDVCAQYYLEDSDFDDVMIAIGLDMVGDLDNINAGGRDDEIRRLGEWISSSDRPVFLRIGYEFDGEWNNYEPESYKLAYVKIVDDLKAMGVDNFVAVWQSAELGDADYYMQWWPGDDYVDWVAYSYFNSPLEEIGQGMLEIAREKNKPVFIAELTPEI